MVVQKFIYDHLLYDLFFPSSCYIFLFDLLLGHEKRCISGVKEKYFKCHQTGNVGTFQNSD